MRNYYTNLTSISAASPAVFTLTDHGLYVGDRIRLATTSALPTGLTVNTDYYVIRRGLTTSTFQVATSDDGSPIATTVAGSGTHSFMKHDNDGLRVAYQDNH